MNMSLILKDKRVFKLNFERKTWAFSSTIYFTQFEIDKNSILLTIDR